jgi:hypothetical protein
MHIPKYNKTEIGISKDSQNPIIFAELIKGAEVLIFLNNIGI